MVYVLQTCIKNVPKTIHDQIEREEYITQMIIWQNKPRQINTQSLRNLASKPVIDGKRDVWTNKYAYNLFLLLHIILGNVPWSNFLMCIRIVKVRRFLTHNIIS